MKLTKELNLLDVFCIASGAMISSGLFILPGLAHARAGPAAVVSYFIAALLALTGMLSQAELVSAMPKAGGVFTGNVDALGGRLKIKALGSVSGSQNLDLSAGNYFTLTSGGNLTLTPTNVPSGTTYAQFIFIRITNPGSG